MKLFFVHFILTFSGTYAFFNYQDDPLLPYNALSATFIFMVGFALLWLSSLTYNRIYFRKIVLAIRFVFYILKELIAANLKLAFDILTPGYYMRPTVIALPLTVKTDLEITALACTISLTPGSLCIDVSKDRSLLYIHVLYVKQNDIALLKENIKNGVEKKLIELTA